MNQALIGLGLIGGIFSLLLFFWWKTRTEAKSAGRTEVALEVEKAQDKAEEVYQEKVEKEMNDVEEIRTRLDTDPSYRSSVQSKFKRKDPS